MNAQERTALANETLDALVRQGKECQKELEALLKKLQCRTVRPVPNKIAVVCLHSEEAQAAAKKLGEFQHVLHRLCLKSYFGLHYVDCPSDD